MRVKTVKAMNGHWKRLRMLGKIGRSLKKHRKFYKRAVNVICEVVVHQINK